MEVVHAGALRTPGQLATVVVQDNVDAVVPAVGPEAAGTSVPGLTELLHEHGVEDVPVLAAAADARGFASGDRTPPGRSSGAHRAEQRSRRPSRGWVTLAPGTPAPGAAVPAL
jgi:hypothetical protein